MRSDVLLLIIIDQKLILCSYMLYIIIYIQYGCRLGLQRPPEAASESMKFKKFLGGMPPDPPSMRAPVGGGGGEGGREGEGRKRRRGGKGGRGRGTHLIEFTGMLWVCSIAMLIRLTSAAKPHSLPEWGWLRRRGTKK